MENARAEEGNGDILLGLLSSLPLLKDYARVSPIEFPKNFSFLLSVLFLLLLLTTSDTATLIERPLQSSALVLLGSGLSIIVLYFALRPRSEYNHDIPMGNQEGGGFYNGILRSPRSRSLLYAAIAIAVRVYILEPVLRNLQCAITGLEAALPIVVAVWEVGKFTKAVQHNRLGLLLPSLLSTLGIVVVSWASFLVARLRSFPRSTVICPGALGFGPYIIALQLCGLVFDAWFLISFKKFLGGHKSVPRHAAATVGSLFMLSAVIILVVAMVLLPMPQYRSTFKQLDPDYVKAIMWTITIFTLMTLSSLWLLSCEWQSKELSTYDSALEIALVVTIMTSTITTPSKNAKFRDLLLPFFLLTFGVILYFSSSRYPSKLAGVMQGRAIRFALFFLLFLSVCIVMSRQFLGPLPGEHFQTHPIDSLMQEASVLHRNWSAQASSSANLADAVKEYVRRYDRHPPPGFDKWFAFATKRDAHVIDDFDGIEKDLRPFWSFSPDHLRTRTKLLLLDTANECAEVSIRSGEARVGRVRPTHRWMVEGIIIMMQNFVTELPDMDIAFNINDEPRVAVPHSARGSRYERAIESKGPLEDKWSVERAEPWAFPENTSSDSVGMEMWSFRKTFREYGSTACPPDSPARRYHPWDSSIQCQACFEPHSIGPFLSDWRLAESPCHQPDLADLHGFYLSPSAFKPTHEILPIFSQSRSGGFSDILYPSAWNYNDKIKYGPSDEYPDVEFPKKENVLFWRGSATEGFSKTGTWKGQTRQRMVHLVNNSTAKLPVLLPNGENGYSYKALSSDEVPLDSSLRSYNFSSSFFFVGLWPRCDDGDCEVQDAEFGLSNSTDFQLHWRHRYLMDADGAGFSGRFLPFLQSHSVPFKTAIFREWYDSRIVAWKHFVPIDIRMHGLWSTLAYFVGGFGTKSKLSNGVDPAESIAEDGRAWASKVLRKEDMEIYFYRLLLEYGRLTDDRRDRLGYGG